MFDRFNESKFRKFPKIENLDLTTEFPIASVCETSKFFVSEKIDGCNLGVYIPLDKETPFSFYSRSGINANTLYNFERDKVKLCPFLEYFRRFCAEELKGVEAVYLWGEYYGELINRRIKYGVDGWFKFYNISTTEDGIDSPIRFNEIMTKFMEQFPIYGEFILLAKEINLKVSNKSDLMDACKFPAKSEVAPTEHREGYVFTCVTKDGEVFRWKHKDPEFLEKKCSGGGKQIDDGDLGTLKALFRDYITENRVYSVLSKTPERNIGKLCGLLMADAKEDFLLENGELLKDKDEDYLKKVFNVGSLGFMTIKTVLAKL